MIEQQGAQAALPEAGDAVEAGGCGRKPMEREDRLDPDSNPDLNPTSTCWDRQPRDRQPLGSPALGAASWSAAGAGCHNYVTPTIIDCHNYVTPTIIDDTHGITHGHACLAGKRTRSVGNACPAPAVSHLLCAGLLCGRFPTIGLLVERKHASDPPRAERLSQTFPKPFPPCHTGPTHPQAPSAKRPFPSFPEPFPLCRASPTHPPSAKRQAPNPRPSSLDQQGTHSRILYSRQANLLVVCSKRF